MLKPKIFEMIKKTILQINAHNEWRKQLSNLGVNIL